MVIGDAATLAGIFAGVPSFNDNDKSGIEENGFIVENMVFGAAAETVGNAAALEVLLVALISAFFGGIPHSLGTIAALGEDLLMWS